MHPLKLVRKGNQQNTYIVKSRRPTKHFLIGLMCYNLNSNKTTLAVRAEYKLNFFGNMSKL